MLFFDELNIFHCQILFLLSCCCACSSFLYTDGRALFTLHSIIGARTKNSVMLLSIHLVFFMIYLLICCMLPLGWLLILIIPSEKLVWLVQFHCHHIPIIGLIWHRKPFSAIWLVKLISNQGSWKFFGV